MTQQAYNTKCFSYTTDGSSKQDRALAVMIPVPETDTFLSLTAVWDGHSVDGETVAMVARDMTHEYFQQVTSDWIDRTDAEWTEQFTQLFAEIHSRFQWSQGGSTAAVAVCFIRADGTKSRLIHANVGDSPIYLIDKVARTGRIISVDHVPDNLDEANRLHRLGPHALLPIYITRVPFPTRIFVKDPNSAGLMKDPHYENRSALWAMGCHPTTVDYDPTMYLRSSAGNISVSRAIGDYKHIPYGMICTPHVASTVIGDNEFVAIMSDGVTDVFQRASLPGMIVDIIENYKSLGEAIAKVTSDAIVQWHTRFGSADDASLAVLI